MRLEREAARAREKEEFIRTGGKVSFDFIPVSIKNIKEEVKKDTPEFFEAEMKRVKQRSMNITRSISGIGFSVGGSKSDKEIHGSIAGALKEALTKTKKKSLNK